MFVDFYSFAEQHPRRYRNRNGKLGPERRDRDGWRRALRGHLKVHDGRPDESCAACRELTERLEAAERKLN